MSYQPIGPIETKLNNLLTELTEEQATKQTLDEIIILQQKQTRRLMLRSYAMGFQNGLIAAMEEKKE